MENPPLFYDEIMSSMAMPIWCSSIEEVRKAEKEGFFLQLPIAVVEGWVQRVTSIDLYNIKDIKETDDGFSFTAGCLQQVTTLLHDYTDEETYQLSTRDSVCMIEIKSGRVEPSFITKISYDYVSLTKQANVVL